MDPFYGGPQQQEQFVAASSQQQQAQHQFVPQHFQYGYVHQPFPPAPPPPYIAPPPLPPTAPNSALASMLPPVAQSFFNSWEAPPPPVPPPADPELQKRIDKLVEFSAKNGPGFEALMREKQKENPAYAFLFGADGHSYYKYKLWITINPHLVAFNPALNMVNPALGLPAASAIANPPPPPGQPGGPFPAFFEPPEIPVSQPTQQQQQMFEAAALMPPQLLKTIPVEMSAELRSVLESLTGAKESIKFARNWFMQRSAFAPALADVVRDSVTGTNDADRQMHLLYLVNDILVNSLQLRVNVKELDPEALAFHPVLSFILAAIFRNPGLSEVDRGQVEKMVQFWGSKEVYDLDTVQFFDREMRGDITTTTFVPPSTTLGQWQKEKSWEQKADHEPQVPATTFTNTSVAALFPALASCLPQQQAPPPPQQPQQQQQQLQVPRADHPPYPHFPPGLIPGMVRKMQIGSGVPYSALSPLDIPTVIPPASSETYILDRVSKFFKDIGEADPLAGKYKSDEEAVEEDKSRGARIPPPSQMQVDPETGTLPDGTIEHRPGMTSTGRLGLGAVADPNEATQYDDVYTSYRKQRSSNYHTSLSARAAAR